MHGRSFVLHAMDQASDAASEQDVRYEQHGAIIAYAAHAVLLGISVVGARPGVSRQARVPPPQGWAFPVLNEKAEEGEAVEKDADEEEEGVFLSRSSSALLTKRLERLGARTTSSSSSSSSGSPWQDVEDPLMQASAHDPYDPSDNAIDDSSDSTAVSDRGASQSDASNAADVTKDGGGLDAAQAAEAEQLAAAAAAAGSAAVQAEQAASDPQASASVAAASPWSPSSTSGRCMARAMRKRRRRTRPTAGIEAAAAAGGWRQQRRQAGRSGRHLYLALCSTIPTGSAFAPSAHVGRAPRSSFSRCHGILRHAPKLGVVSSFRTAALLAAAAAAAIAAPLTMPAGAAARTAALCSGWSAGRRRWGGWPGRRCALGVTTDGWCKDGMSDRFAGLDAMASWCRLRRAGMTRRGWCARVAKVRGRQRAAATTALVG